MARRTTPSSCSPPHDSAAPTSSTGGADCAAATAAVLTQPAPSQQVYELAGDDAYNLAEFETALKGAGLSDGLAALLADSDACAAQGALFDNSRQLSALIGQPTTLLAEAMAPAQPPRSALTGQRDPIARISLNR